MDNFKIKFGEVLTSPNGVEYLLDQLPSECWNNPNLTWLDIGSGTGNIINGVIDRLHIGLSTLLKDYEKRDKHIRENMIYVSEINVYHREKLQKITKNYYEDVFKINKTFDIVLSNPPYVMEGEKKVPSKINICKKKDGKTVWPSFVDKAFSLSEIYCGLIIPPLWLRNNPGNARELIIKNIYKCMSLNYYKANKIFNKQGQTPVTIITLSKINNENLFFDKKYIAFNPIDNIFPTDNYSIIDKLIPFVIEYGCIKVIKTNLPPKNVKFSETESSKFKYKNIKTTTLKNGNIYEYSNKELKYSYPKIILAHKAIGLPFMDYEGIGISTRDNYIIESLSETLLLFLKSKLVRKVFESFRYRMRFLEKEAFLYLPNIDNIPNFPIKVNDTTISNFFSVNI